MKRLAIGIVGATVLAGCASEQAALAPPLPGAPAAVADVRSAAGQGRARAVATQIGDSISVRIDAENMARGSYGAHIHTTGRCDPPGFESAGPHWNPTGQQHGKNNPAGMHKGDLPNLMIGADGRGTLEMTIPGAWVAGGAAPMLDADGAAVVIHQGPDDYRTDPSGNSGARIACGVFR